MINDSWSVYQEYIRIVKGPGWVSWVSISLLISVQVMISQWWDQTTWRVLAWAWDLLRILSLLPSLALSHSLFLCPSPAYGLSVSISQKNCKKLKKGVYKSYKYLCAPSWTNQIYKAKISTSQRKEIVGQ